MSPVEPAGAVQLQNLIVRLINISVPLTFMLLTAMLVFAGIKFITSQGDPKGVAAAKSMIFWSILGVGFLAFAWIAIKMIETFTGVPLTLFCIGFKGSGAGLNGCT